MELSKADHRRIARWNKLLSTVTKRMTAPQIAKLLKCSRDTVRDDCIELAKMGYINVEDMPVERGRAIGYLPIKDKIDMNTYQPFTKRQKQSYVKKSDVIEFVGVLPNSRVIRQVDSVRWTPRTPQRRSAWVGSTLNTMTF